MTSPRKLQILAEAVLSDDNVELAVVFGPTRESTASLTLLLDCKQDDSATVRRIAAALANRLQEGVDIFRLADARPAAILMRKALSEGQVLKDTGGGWGKLQAERDRICEQAEAHERWERDLYEAIDGVLTPDESVTLAVAFAPSRTTGESDSSDLDVLLGCVDESEEALLAAYGRLKETGFRIEVMPLAQALDFPYALSHIVRTGRPLKDVDGQWEKLQAERSEIIAAGAKQHRETQAIKRMLDGPTSMN